MSHTIRIDLGSAVKRVGTRKRGRVVALDERGLAYVRWQDGSASWIDTAALAPVRQNLRRAA